MKKRSGEQAFGTTGTSPDPKDRVAAGASQETKNEQPAAQAGTGAAVDYPVIRCPGCASTDNAVEPNGNSKDGSFRYRKCRQCRLRWKEFLRART